MVTYEVTETRITAIESLIAEFCSSAGIPMSEYNQLINDILALITEEGD